MSGSVCWCSLFLLTSTFWGFVECFGGVLDCIWTVSLDIYGVRVCIYVIHRTHVELNAPISALLPFSQPFLSPVNFPKISIIRTSIFYPDISISICGQALSASKVMDIFSLALSVFNEKHEIKMIVFIISGLNRLFLAQTPFFYLFSFNAF